MTTLKSSMTKHIVCLQTNLKGTTLLSDSEMAQKSRDSILLIGAIVQDTTEASFLARVEAPSFDDPGEASIRSTDYGCRLLHLS